MPVPDLTQFFYHGTNTYALQRIQQEGLCNAATTRIEPVWKYETNPAFIYVTIGSEKGLESARAFAKDSVKHHKEIFAGIPNEVPAARPVILRFDREKLPQKCQIEYDPIERQLPSWLEPPISDILQQEQKNPPIWRAISGCPCIPPTLLEVSHYNWFPLKDVIIREGKITRRSKSE